MVTKSDKICWPAHCPCRQMIADFPGQRLSADGLAGGAFFAVTHDIIKILNRADRQETKQNHLKSSCAVKIVFPSNK